MNREFILRDITPAQARKLVGVLKTANLYVDPVIHEVAQRDKLLRGDVGLPHDAPTKVMRTVQFIRDHDFRCVIPYSEDAEAVRIAIAASIPAGEEILLADQPVHWPQLLGSRPEPLTETATARFLSTASATLYEKVREVTAHRHRILIVKVSEPSSLTWIGKLMPRMIIMAPTTIQGSFDFTGKHTTTWTPRSAAASIYPFVNEAISRDGNLRGVGRTLYPLLGVCQEMLSQPKSLRKQMEIPALV